MGKEMIDVGVIQFINAPYRDDSYTYLQEHYPIRLHIATFNFEDNHPEWEYKNKAAGTNDSIKSFLKQEKYGALIICGYSEKVSRQALIYARLHGIPIVMMVDTVEGHKLKRIKRVIYSSVDSFWVPGDRSRKYLLSKKVDISKIYTGGYTYDYRSIKKRIDILDRNKLRSDIGILDNEFVFLFVGKLIPTRRIKDLICAFRGMKEENIRLIVIGDGEEQALIDQAVQSDKRIISIPKVNLEHLYDYYSIADAYIHPGKEPYSCAVMQATAAALPVIATDAVGAVDDYMNTRETNLIIKLGDIPSMRKSMKAVCHDYKEYKQSALEIQSYVCENLSIDYAADQLYKAIMHAIGMKNHD